MKSPLHLVDGELIKTARRKRGFTLVGLSNLVDLSASQIARMEQGGNWHRESTCRVLASALKLSLDDVIMRKKPDCLTEEEVNHLVGGEDIVLDGTKDYIPLIETNIITDSDCPICADFKILTHKNQGLIRQLVDALCSSQRQLKTMRASLDSLLEGDA